MSEFLFRSNGGFRNTDQDCSTYFTKSDRCFLQPHMGGLTKAAWFKAFQEAMNNIEQFFETGKAISPINEKEVEARR